MPPVAPVILDAPYPAEVPIQHVEIPAEIYGPPKIEHVYIAPPPGKHKIKKNIKRIKKNLNKTSKQNFRFNLICSASTPRIASDSCTRFVFQTERYNSFFF